MTHPRQRERDQRFLNWIVQQGSWLECGCLICAAPPERCHLVGGGLGGGGGSDYWVYPACHFHHFERDHSLRGARHTTSRADWDVVLAVWWNKMAGIRERYVNHLIREGIEIPEPLSDLVKVLHVYKGGVPSEALGALSDTLGPILRLDVV